MKMKCMRRSSIVSLLLPVLFVASCGQESGPGGVDQETDPIVNGTAFTAAQNVAPFSSAVAIWPRAGFSSAIKIGPRRYLTAGHALIGARAGDALSMTNTVDLSGQTSYTIQNVYIHASYLLSKDAGGASPSLGFDVGVFDIAQTNAIPVFSDFRPDYIPVGMNGSLVGYGCSVNGAGANFVKRLGVMTSTAGSYPTDWFVHYFLQDGAVQGCSGDSGGPLFVRSASNAWQIGGVNARGPNPTMLTRAGSVLAWIQAPATNDFSANASGTFLNQLSGMCMAVSGASTASGGDVRQYFDEQRAQSTSSGWWTLVPSINGQSGVYKQLVNGHSGLCLGVDGGSTADGANVSQYPCDNSFNQSWGFSQNPQSAGFYQIKNFKSGKCLGVANGSVDNDGDIRQYNCVTQASGTQNWVFTK